MSAGSDGTDRRDPTKFERLRSGATFRPLWEGRAISLFGGQVPLRALAALAVFLPVFVLLYLALWELLGNVGLVLGWIAALLVAAVAVLLLNTALATPRSRPGGLSRPTRHALRFLADIAIVGGLLLVADAAATLLWQEPVSAVLASRAQAELESELEESGDLGPADPSLRPRVVLQTLARRYERRTGEGDALGKIEIPAIDASFTFVEGTDTGSLRKGPGHYPTTSLPGDRGTVALAGHRTTYLAPFRDIDDLNEGDSIRLQMPYGRFEYSVKGTRIVDPSDVSVLSPRKRARIVLTACHPLYSADERIVVFGRLSDATPTCCGAVKPPGGG